MTVPRICFVVSSPLTAHAFLTAHIRALSEEYEVHLVVNAEPAEITHPDLKRARLHHARIERSISPVADTRALFQLFRIMRRGRFAAIHTITPKAGLLGAVAAFAARVPVRMHTFTGQVWATRSGARRWFLKTLDRVIIALDTHILTDSASQRDFLRAQGVLRPHQGEVIGHGSISGVDAGRFRADAAARTALRTRLGIPESAFVFLFVGRLTRDKGVPELADAFAQIARERKHAYLVLVGPDEDALGPSITAAGRADPERVRLPGLSAEPEKFMAAADVFCLPSHREGFGSVILEAAAAGLPAIGSRIYGIVDAVEDGLTGILVEAGDVAALAHAMRRLMGDEDYRKSLGAAAQQRALADFAHEKVTAGLVGLYRRLVPIRASTH